MHNPFQLFAPRGQLDLSELGCAVLSFYVLDPLFLAINLFFKFYDLVMQQKLFAVIVFEGLSR
jgi:hypothetical protein